MKIDQSVDIPAPVDRVWRFLDDVPSVARCMPGARLTNTVDGSTYEGLVKVAIGPLAMNYTGSLTIEQRDEADRTVVLRASGRDRRGSGTAQARVTVRLVPDDRHTRMRMTSDVRLTGRIASLGRGVQDVSNKLFAEFAQRMAAELQPATATATAGGHATQAPAIDLAGPHSPTSPATARASDGSIKLTALVVSVTRQRLAELLLRLAEKVRP